MFVREHQNQFRGAQADVKTFYGNYAVTSNFAWDKPVGTTFVYIMLIGAGGAGDGSSTGGGTGAITTWIGSARHIPNAVTVQISTTNTSLLTNIGGVQKTIFSAAAANVTLAGVASAVDGYYASGFYNFTVGLNGTTGNPSSSTTTFLQNGAAVTAASTGNYGYTRSASQAGYFFLSPIPVGLSSGSPANPLQRGAYGCGAYYTNITSGGPGMAVIASW